MNRFAFSDLPLFGLKLIERQRLGDSRGFLSRLFCSDELALAGWHKPIAQVNHTFTDKRGTVRGLHYQLSPHSEMKLVTCIRGEVWDIVVDLRKGSPTFLHWHAEILAADNNKALLIPEGLAHGFQTLTHDVTLVYCHTSAYSSESERGINAQDQQLSINWPLEITEISLKDANHPMLDLKFEGLKL